MQSSPVPGDLVRVRGRLWRVRSVEPHGACSALDLESYGEARRSRRVTLLTPFDRPRALGETMPMRAASRQRWARHVASLLAHAEPADALLAPARSNLDLFDFQLEPAIAMALDGVARVLIADGVGLGKTIQAGLIIAELRLRHLADRVLVLTPPGLRHQWARELRRRFHLPCTVIDAATLAEMRSRLPATVNPWSASPVAVTSLDFVKRPDVEPGPAGVPWDLVVVDEAHTAAAGTARRETAHRLASRSPSVVLLTATPHAGDDGAFASLCGLGAILGAAGASVRGSSARHPDGTGSLLVFRRTRAGVGRRVKRRVHLRSITPTPAEQQMYASLVAFARTVWSERLGSGLTEARLVATVLLKRSLSGPASLLRSLEHRLDVLAGSPDAGGSQLALFASEDDSPDEFTAGAVAGPGLQDFAREADWLERIADEARAAARAPSKVSALVRVLSRIGEPVIVFTEYRDTLLDLADRIRPVAPYAVLHGGLDHASRMEALRLFTRGRARVLLATDAAGEGLNLQARCRFVVNLELPWNPMRLEQRVGRVDRIGQSRTVHALHLIARHTLESFVLARLVGRVDRARTALGELDSPLGPIPDIDLAGAYLGGDGVGGVQDRPPEDSPRKVCAHHAPSDDILTRAREERSRSERRRRFYACRALTSRTQRGRPAKGPGCAVAWVSGRQRLRSWEAFGLGLTGGLLLVFEARLVSQDGQLLETSLVPVWAACDIRRQRRRRATFTAVTHAVDAVRPVAVLAARRAIEERAATLSASLEAQAKRRRDREAAVAWMQAATDHRIVQAGLFEHRALRGAPPREPDRRYRSTWLLACAGSDAPGNGCVGDAPRLAGEPVLVAVFGLLSRKAAPCSPA